MLRTHTKLILRSLSSLSFGDARIRLLFALCSIFLCSDAILCLMYTDDMSSAPEGVFLVRNSKLELWLFPRVLVVIGASLVVIGGSGRVWLLLRRGPHLLLRLAFVGACAVLVLQVAHCDHACLYN